jgi:hypothetical protein
MESLIFTLINNWEVVGLIITNLVALFVKPPKLNKKPSPNLGE